MFISILQGALAHRSDVLLQGAICAVIHPTPISSVGFSLIERLSVETWPGTRVNKL
ncbi:hypothetical protein [Mesorhizobium sp.]|uniref:hypothetical protein n=1 Tax=Mesorhizobium sp. TaxID=1871066 RepID=UPI00257DC9A5|nr:hypothetical protein [Mesorhizobium sp.]